jgi:serine/threonine protein kinase/TPR repeat protein
LANFKPGDVILGKYELVEKLGEGGMGVVWSAQHRELGGLVALKFLHDSIRGKEELVARFKREARALHRLQSEHVARVLDVVETPEGVPFIVMQHLTGRDLSDVIEERGPLPVAEAADVLLQACEAIHEAHSAGIVHRDLKPANLFVTTGLGGRQVVKVLDFGISKTADANDMSMTASSSVLGSPLYMSPEQFLSPKEVGPRSDIWALGIILYEMLTAKTPFVGETLGVVSWAVREGKYTPPREIRPEIPEAIERLIGDALETTIAKRLPDVASFAARLAPFRTSAAGESSVLMGLIAAQSQPPPASRPMDTAAASGELAEVERRPSRRVTMAESVDDSRATTKPPPKRWGRVAAIGGVAAAAVAAATVIVVPQLRHPQAAPSPSVADAAVADLSADAASNTGEHAAADNAGSAAPAAASAAPSASPAPVASTGTTGGAPPAGASASTPAGVPACAGGATAECEAACTEHRPGSCAKLAEALMKGRGAPKNVNRAVSLYDEDCQAGSAASCNALAPLLMNGDGVTKDLAHGMRLYDQACRLGNAKACVSLGLIHLNSDGAAKSPELAATNFDQGCTGGELKGCLELSRLYGQGRGVPRNFDKAFELADRACTAGLKEACVQTALSKIAGNGVPKDVKGGRTQLDDLCTKREVSACETLMNLFTRGFGDLQADPLLEQQYAAKACALKSQSGCDHQKLLSKSGATEEHMSAFNQSFQAACEKGEAVACGMLGANLVDGIGISKDRDKGIAYLKQACSGKVKLSCEKLAAIGAQ